MPPIDLKSLQKTLGPGILFASTAIGVSHLVQSTKAGADFGIALVWAVVIANILKYPFFEFGTRYAAASGKSLIDGYKKMGWWMLGLYALMTLITMWMVVAAVGSVTAAFLDNLFGISQVFGNNSQAFIPPILLAICGSILFIGNYALLSKIIKVVAAFLLISTLAAFSISLTEFDPALFLSASSFEFSNPKHAVVLIALMGWMPTAVDLSAWNSLWTIEKIKESDNLKVRDLLLEFRIGYWISAVLAVFFIVMGAILLYGSGNTLPAGGAAFANHVIEMYTRNFGRWSYPIIASAAFSIMFGTCLAVLDGYARSAKHVIKISFPTSQKSTSIYKWSLVAVVIGSSALIYAFDSNMKALVNLATIASFLIAPIIAIANLHLVTTMKNKAYRPSHRMKLLSYIGIFFLIGFGVYYFAV